MASAQTGGELKIGTIVPSSFDAGFVAASFFASLTGCLLTVEILHRRGTALRNWRSWLETLACATSMGLIGIWCMHFIGNRAIVLGNGDDSIQLYYNTGWTLFSVFLPILGLSGAFAVAEIRLDSVVVHRLAIGFSGVLAGLSVVGMHYAGNVGVTNYSLRYSARYFAASFVIAIGDCLTVLVLFYRLREQWISDWWKRLICAVLLAGGVSAMHFTASTNCTYVFVRYRRNSGNTSRNVPVAVAGVLCGATGLLVICWLFYYRHRHKIYRSRSKKIVLACALFDPDGRLLVTNEGAFPCKEITDQYNYRSFDEEFGTAHPVFQWIFRVTHNWSSVIDLVPGMSCHLGGCQTDLTNSSIEGVQPSRIFYDSETYSNHSVMFREQFCMAAISLAIDMQVPIRKLGVLYDQVIGTGALIADRAHTFRLDSDRTESWPEINSNLEVVGRGQMLFVTRQASREEASRLLNTGRRFRFAEFGQVRRLLASFLRIPLAVLDVHLDRLARYSCQLQSPGKSGTRLGFFALVPTPGRRCFDIAVQRGNTQRLPDVSLLPAIPNEVEMQSLQKLHDLTINACLRELADTLVDVDDPMTPEQSFAFSLRRAISELTARYPNAWLRHARFLAKPLVAHHHGRNQEGTTQTTLYSFYVIIDMHSWDKSLDLERVPLSFFNVRQRCYPNSPDHAVFARDIHQEFGPLLARRSTQGPHRCYFRRSRLMLNGRSSMWSFGDSSPVWSHESTGSADDDNAGVEMPGQPIHLLRRQNGRAESTWGGILVSSETVMKDDTKHVESVTSNEVGEPMGVNVAVSTMKPEWTFVDELLAVAKARFVRRSV